MRDSRSVSNFQPSGSTQPLSLIMLPGMQCTEPTFAGVVSELAELAPTWDCHILPIRSASTPAAVDEVVAAAAPRAASGPVLLVGHSLGGSVALATARLHPELVAGLVCLNANPRNPTDEQRNGWLALRSECDQPDQQRWTATVENMITLWHGRPSDDNAELRECSRQMIENTGLDGLRAQLGVQLSRVDERPGLTDSRCPVLAIAGGRDAVVPRDRTEEIAERSRGEFVLIDDGDHLTPMSRPVSTAATIADWAQRKITLAKEPATISNDVTSNTHVSSNHVSSTHV